jgi:CMP-N,N'-diacetyllegionaminic acid synthase
LKAKKCFCFDIDGVIATLTPENNYNIAKPIQSTVDVIQTLHKLGHEIILFTARGSKTGIDWRTVTESQMLAWGVPYHELRFGKPAADLYIDDRMISVGDIGKLSEILK